MKALLALFMKTVSVLGQIPNLGKMTMNQLPELEINLLMNFLKTQVILNSRHNTIRCMLPNGLFAGC